MNAQTFTADSLKGTFTGSIEECIAWQEEVQGAYFSIDNVSEDDMVVVETMPEYLRATHEAAGGPGRYPGNGAQRVVTDSSMVDEDEWTRIVRRATLQDCLRYGFRSAL